MALYRLTVTSERNGPLLEETSQDESALKRMAIQWAKERYGRLVADDLEALCGSSGANDTPDEAYERILQVAATLGATIVLERVQE